MLKIGWPSINVLSSSDYKYVALTDYDRWPEDIDGEGDGFSLASKRTTTFMSAGMTLSSVKLREQPSRIWYLLNSRVIRQWHMTTKNCMPPITVTH